MVTLQIVGETFLLKSCYAF